MTARRILPLFLVIIALGLSFIPRAFAQIEIPKDAFSLVLIHADLDDIEGS